MFASFITRALAQDAPHGLMRRQVAALLCAALMMMPHGLFAASTPTMIENGFSLAAFLGVEPALTAGIFLGIIVASFIYLLSTWFAVRDRSQIYLMLMLLCLMVHVAADTGYVDRMNGDSVLSQFVTLSSLILFYIFSCIFTIIFLELDARGAFIRFFHFGAIGILLIAALMAAFDLNFVIRVMPFLGLGVLLLLIMTSLISWMMRVSGSVAHLAAFGVVLVGSAFSLPMEMLAPGMPQQSGDVAAISYALCAMLFAVVIASQFAHRQELKEKELATSNERFQMAALGSNEGLYDWDMKQGKGYFSDRLRRILGIHINSQKRPLKTWYRLIHPEDRAMVRKALFTFLKNKTEKTLTIDARIVRPDKHIAWISTSVVVVRNAQTGKAMRVIGSVGDVTEKKRAEAGLRASEKRFRSIAEAHPVPVLIATLKEGEIVYASHGSEAVLGLSVQELLGMTLARFFKEQDTWTQLMHDVQKSGGVNLREFILQRSDYRTFDAAVSARLISYDRRPCAVVGINDISARKQAEEKIKDQEAALQQSEKLAALGGLLAGVAHELNNPLSVIVGQAVLLRESAKDEKTTGRADKIHKAGERCARIVKSFLALARRKPPERKPVAINEVIENAIELLAFQLRTDNVELHKKLSDNLPPALADSDQMTQVITNLVINAKQVLQDREGVRRITVETWHLPSDEGLSDGHICVSVTDNGTGVPHELQHRIFEPFFTTKPAGSGTGVGLSLCHNIIDGHGGRIWVEDAEGGGARFIFTLPANPHTMVRENLNAMVDAPVKAVPPQRILIVDDEVELAQTLADILEPDGHSMVLVDNGRKALDWLAKQDFDIIISDLRMPVLDGPGLYKELEKTRHAYLSRIIFVTGDTLSIPVRDFLNSYALDVLEKPYSPEDVRRALLRLTKDNARNTAKGTDSHALPPA